MRSLAFLLHAPEQALKFSSVSSPGAPSFDCSKHPVLELHSYFQQGLGWDSCEEAAVDGGR